MTAEGRSIVAGIVLRALELEEQGLNEDDALDQAMREFHPEIFDQTA